MNAKMSKPTRIRNLISIACSGEFIARFLHMMFFDGVTKCFGVIVETIVSQSQMPYRIVGWIFTWQLASCYFATPLVTVLLRSGKPRLWTTAAGFCVGLGFVCLGLTINISLWCMLLATSLSGIGLSILMTVTVVNLKKAFTDDSYSTAYATSCLGTNVGISTFPVFLSILKANYGITGGLIIFGAFLWNEIIIGLVATKKGGRSSGAGGWDEEVPCLKGETSPDTDKTLLPFEIFWENPDFLLFLILSLLVETNFVAWAVYLVPYGESVGISPQSAVLLSTIGGTSGFLGKLFVTNLAYFDYLNPLTVFTVPSLLIAVSYASSFSWNTFGGLAIASLISGFCIGLQGSGRFSMLGLVVSNDHFNSAVAWLYTGYVLSTLSGGVVAGLVRDLSGDFQSAFGFLAIVCLLSLILSLVWAIHKAKRQYWRKN